MTALADDLDEPRPESGARGRDRLASCAGDGPSRAHAAPGRASRPTTLSRGAGSPARCSPRSSWRNSGRNPSIWGKSACVPLLSADVGGRTAQPLPTPGACCATELPSRSPSWPLRRGACNRIRVRRTSTATRRNVHLAVNRNNVALLTYRADGRLHHTLAWGAVNARTPRRGMKQISFKLDYSGGWGSRRKDVWRGFKNACRSVRRPASSGTSSRPARRPTARTGSSRSGAGCSPRSASSRRSHSAPWRCISRTSRATFPSSWSSSTGCTRGTTTCTAGSSTRARASTGSRRRSTAPPLDTWGRNVFVDTYDSRYGRGWKRENGFLTHRGSGAFCYGFYPHGNRPVGKGTEYRATVMGPGVTPILVWQGAGARPVRRPDRRDREPGAAHDLHEREVPSPLAGGARF